MNKLDDTYIFEDIKTSIRGPVPCNLYRVGDIITAVPGTLISKTLDNFYPISDGKLVIQSTNLFEDSEPTYVAVPHGHIDKLQVSHWDVRPDVHLIESGIFIPISYTKPGQYVSILGSYEINRVKQITDKGVLSDIGLNIDGDVLVELLIEPGNNILLEDQ